MDLNWHKLIICIVCPTWCGEHGCVDNTTDTCCHSACLGGCSGPTAQDCHVCRGYSLGYGAERKCMDSCPIGTYVVSKYLCAKYSMKKLPKIKECIHNIFIYIQLSRRCVTEQACRAMPAPPKLASDTSNEETSSKIRKYKIFNGTCIYACGSGYMEVSPTKSFCGILINW